MIFLPTPLSGSFVIETLPIYDERGCFERFYCKKEFEDIGHVRDWVQLNHSVTKKKGTIRGMHFQKTPYEEIKMVKCIKGSILDVILDLRKNSSTLLQWYAIELSDSNNKMIYIPAGFAHGFQSLTDDCELIYHHSQYYNPNAESGIHFNDPRIQINWPLPVTMVSQRDLNNAYLDKTFNGI